MGTVNVSVTVLHIGKRKALYKSSLIYNKIYFFRDRSLLIQKIYTLSCLAVMFVDLLVFYYAYHQFTHFQKNNSGGNGLSINKNWQIRKSKIFY